MLQIVVPPSEKWDEAREEFVTFKGQKLQLEHSLVSISKWEAKWKKPFLTKDEKTIEETIDYIKCMTLTQNVHPDVYLNLTSSNYKEINEYVASQRTATWFNEDDTPKNNRQTITSELIYYWMTALNIPMECQKWHLSRLLTLIRVANEENKPKKQPSKSDIYKHHRALHAKRRAKR